VPRWTRRQARSVQARTRARLLAVALLVAGACVGLYGADALRPLELVTIDARFAVREPQKPPRDVEVVAIDDVTFGDLKRTWPFPRSLHGRVIDVLKRDGARSIAYDIQFTEPTTASQDLALYDAVARAGNVILGTTEVGSGGRTNVLGGDANLAAAHAMAATANYRPDPGDVIRRFPYSVEGLGEPSRPQRGARDRQACEHRGLR
jgi:adenylate cyclase